MIKLLVNREYGFRIQPARFPCLSALLFSVDSNLFLLNVSEAQEVVLIAKNINLAL